MPGQYLSSAGKWAVVVGTGATSTMSLYWYDPVAVSRVTDSTQPPGAVEQIAYSPTLGYGIGGCRKGGKVYRFNSDSTVTEITALGSNTFAADTIYGACWDSVNETFVLMGSNSTYISSDGTSWTGYPNNISVNYGCMTPAPEINAIGYFRSGRSAISYDGGKSWTQETFTDQHSMAGWGPTFGSGGLFIAGIRSGGTGYFNWSPTAGIGFTNLTLTDNTDLDNFRVGDLVSSSLTPVSVPTAVDLNQGTGGSPAFSTAVEFNSTWAADNTSIFMGSQPGQYVKFKVGAGTWKVYFQRVATNDVNITVTGTFQSGASEISATSSSTNFETYVFMEPGEITFKLKNYASGSNTGWNLKPVDTTWNGSTYGIPPFNSGEVSGINSTSNKLILKDVQGTWNANGTAIGPATSPATGTVGSVDANNNLINLSDSDEIYPKRWIVNQGKYLIGEEKPSKDAAPDAEGLTLISSAFESTPPGSIGQTAASWQVAAYNDISFSSPVAEQLNRASELTEWEVVPELEADTKYRCRVRHISSDQESEWSDASTFRTAGKGIAVTSQPGVAYHFQAQSNPNGVFSAVDTSNVLIQNLAGAYSGAIYYLGIDGFAYKANTKTSVSTTLAPEFGTNLVSIWHNYDNNGPGWLSCSSSGELLGKTANGTVGTVSYPAGYTARRIIGGGGVTYPCIVELVNDATRAIRYYGFNSQNITSTYNDIGTHKFASVPTDNYQLEDLGFPDVLSDGGTIVDIAGIVGNYSMAMILILSSTGNLFVSGTTPDASSRYGNFPTNGTNAVPVPYDTGGTLFRHVGSLGAAYNANGGVSGVTVTINFGYLLLTLIM